MPDIHRQAYSRKLPDGCREDISAAHTSYQVSLAVSVKPWNLVEQPHSVWKPVDNPVEQWSLAVCDGNTIGPSDLVETDSVRRGNVTTLYYARYSPTQKWSFLRQQTPEEALIFKHFDSESDVNASCEIGSCADTLRWKLIFYYSCYAFEH